MIGEYLRLKMTELTVGGNDYPKVSDIEFYLPKLSYTIVALEILNKKYSENDLYY
ncbi:MAG: hypothetical protein ACK5L7_09875 [Paludibacteraceae bacterium]